MTMLLDRKEAAHLALIINNRCPESEVQPKEHALLARLLWFLLGHPPTPDDYALVSEHTDWWRCTDDPVVNLTPDEVRIARGYVNDALDVVRPTVNLMLTLHELG